MIYDSEKKVDSTRKQTNNLLYYIERWYHFDTTALLPRVYPESSGGIPEDRLLSGFLGLSRMGIGRKGKVEGFR